MVSKVRIFSQFFVVIPSITSSPNNELKNQIENVTFLCQAAGEPIPSTSWYFNGVMINVSDNSSKYMIISRSLNITTTENTLTVYNVTSFDVGTYTCRSTNFIGSSTSSGILTVTSELRNSITSAQYSSSICKTLYPFMDLISYTIV